ncbi:glycosyltransferase family 2 protein [Streptococcus sp. zg-JUN1979]|uniref:glycosyltransferase family 2 protein n=1 Tax=Streptococcus sp. zg-JUN1979 TaxID=3391450 RepID=UPI0039A725E9
MDKISVIVPVYNGQNHLKACIESILRQDYQNLEIIIINDGSTDQTALICQELAASDSRIRVHHKTRNQGIGAARNTALSLITGNLFLFIDSDDWIDPNHISDLHRLLTETDSDIAICNFTQYIEKTNSYNIHITDQDYYQAIYTPTEWFNFQYGQPHNLSLCFTTPWCKLYKRSLFDHIRYPEHSDSDDDKTTWKAYLLSDKIAYMHRSSYIYRVNDASMTQNRPLSEVFDCEPVFERLAVLAMLGMDTQKELEAYKWRLHLKRNHALETSDMMTYQDLSLHLQLLQKYQ